MRKFRIGAATIAAIALTVTPFSPASAASGTQADTTGDVGVTSIDITNLTVSNTVDTVTVEITTAGPATPLADPSWDDGATPQRSLAGSFQINGSEDEAQLRFFEVTDDQVEVYRLAGEEVASICTGADAKTTYAASANTTTITLDAECIGTPARIDAFATYALGDDFDVSGIDNTGKTDIATFPFADIEPVSAQEPGGQYLLAADGGVFSLGDSQFYGSTGNIKLNEPVVGLATNPTGEGYWFVAADGGVFTYGPAADIQFHGSQGANKLNQPVVGMAPTSTGEGYYLVAADGGIFTHGDAEFYGSMGDKSLNQPIVGMATVPGGEGYYLVAADGGIFSFGPDAEFDGSTGNLKLNQPVIGMATVPGGDGYYLVAKDGGVFNFGDDADFYGSGGGTFPQLKLTAAGIDVDANGGYRIATADGQVFEYGEILNYGDYKDQSKFALNQPIVGLAAK